MASNKKEDKKEDKPKGEERNGVYYDGNEVPGVGKQPDEEENQEEENQE